MSILRAEAIEVSYGKDRERKVFLSGFHLDARKGELVAIIGRNGAGKSSLLRVLAGVQEAQGGHVHWQGIPVAKIPYRQRPLYTASLFREFTRVHGLTVYDLAAMGRIAVNGSFFGRISPADHQRIMYCLEVSGMLPFAERQTATLSDGEFQKALVAKMLAQDAPILLLDEPTTHLDMPSSLELMHLLQRLAVQEGKCVVFTSHALHLVFKMVHTLVLLSGEGTYIIDSPEKVASDSLMCAFLKTNEISVVDGNLQFNIESI